jgi:hypothetical protein
MHSATVMATLPRSEPPRSRNIVGHRPRLATPSASSRRSSQTSRSYRDPRRSADLMARKGQ